MRYSASIDLELEMTDRMCRLHLSPFLLEKLIASLKKIEQSL